MMNVRARGKASILVSMRNFYADITVTPYLEGLVIIKKNPDFVDTSAAAKAEKMDTTSATTTA